MTTIEPAPNAPADPIVVTLPDLDALRRVVLERLGWRVERIETSILWKIIRPDGINCSAFCSEEDARNALPDPATRIGDAWPLFLQLPGFVELMRFFTIGQFRIDWEIGSEKHYGPMAPTAEAAICLAWLAWQELRAGGTRVWRLAEGAMPPAEAEEQESKSCL